MDVTMHRTTSIVAIRRDFPNSEAGPFQTREFIITDENGAVCSLTAYCDPSHEVVDFAALQAFAEEVVKCSTDPYLVAQAAQALGKGGAA